MRLALLLSPALILAAAAACGGSSSETPWPVEPEASQLGPAQESLTPPTITEEKDGGASLRGGAKPKTP